MAVTSGFFNSINGDRKYDALQMAELFDGLINDGVYETIYNRFRVSPNNGFTIQVDTGRGWFKHTWIKNDNLKLLTHDAPHVLYDRIDAVVIEVDHRDQGRKDDIKIIKGTPSASPARPTLSKTNELWQVPLAYVTVKTNAASITTANITNMIGTSSCPFVTGVVSVMDIDMLIAQWQAQWNDRLKVHEKDFENWFGKMNDRLIGYEYDFQDWFKKLQVILEGNVAANLADRLLQLENFLDLMVKNGGMTVTTIDDSNGRPIIDSFNHEINGLVNMFGSGGNCTC